MTSEQIKNRLSDQFKSSVIENENLAEHQVEIKGEDWFDVATFMKNDPKLSFCLLYTSPSPRDKRQSRMPSSA